MTRAWIAIVAICSFPFPGLGHGVMARPRAMVTWFVVGLGSALVSLWSVAFYVVTIAVHLACAVVTYRELGRHAARVVAASISTPLDAPRAVVAGHAPERGARWSRPLGVLALLLGMIGGAVISTSMESFKIPASSMVPTLQIGDHFLVDKLSLRWRPVTRGEVIVFAQPCSGHTFVKRVVAVAGQTVEVRCDVLYVDGVALPTRPLGNHCRYDDVDPMSETRTSRSCSGYVETNDGHTYDTYHAEDRPDRPADEPGTADFPSAIEPPRCERGEVIGTLIQTRSDAGACDQQRHYVVPAGHVFVLGDNRANSFDSRFWGPVPEDHIIGRAVGIFFPSSRTAMASRFGAID